MGNCVSSASIIQVENVITPRIRVVQAGEGRVVEVEVPDSQMTMTVAELLLEFPPGHFVAHFDHSDFITAANNGKRASPLAADAEAKSGHLYVLFPMPRLHTRVTPHELLAFANLLQLRPTADKLPSKAAAPKRQCRRGARVAPSAEEDDITRAAGNTEQAINASSCQNDHQPLMMFCPNSSNSPITTSCHGQMQVIKSKPWAPKLETIQESY